MILFKEYPKHKSYHHYNQTDERDAGSYGDILRLVNFVVDILTLGERRFGEWNCNVCERSEE